MSTLYGAEFATIPLSRLHSLRRRVWQAARGDRRPMNEFALELAFTIFAEGHRVDAAQALEYQRIVHFARMVFDLESLADLSSIVQFYR